MLTDIYSYTYNVGNVGGWGVADPQTHHSASRALSQMQIEAFVVKAVAAWNVSPARKMRKSLQTRMNFIQSTWEEQ